MLTYSPSHVLDMIRETKIGGMVAKSTTEFRESQNQNLSWAAKNCKRKDNYDCLQILILS